MAKYIRKPEVFEAEQFFPNKPRPRGVDEQTCFCADVAQDGRRCELHKENGRRYGWVTVARQGAAAYSQRREINPGEWIVTAPDGTHSVISDDEFKNTYFRADLIEPTR